MGLVWLTDPVWHGSRVPSYYNFSAMTPEQIELVTAPWLYWFEADWHYSRTTVYFFCVAIFLFGLINLIFQLRQRESTADTIRKIPLYTKITAISRSLGARQFAVLIATYYSPPLSAIIIVLGIIVFFCVLVFAPHPYTWPDFVKPIDTSPPIGTRTGWISIGILPFVFIFATKFNLIGIVSGVSHEKLQIYHRYSSWIMYITSLIHTFCFIIENRRNGRLPGLWYTEVYYWSGTAALIPQTWLMFMSWGPLRNRYYETFKKLHLFASAIFICFLFIHCDFRLSSWDYFAATAGIYVFSWLVRVLRTFFNGVCSGVTLEALPEDMVKITIPTKATWRAGQHFFVRFLDLGVHAASSHPFTVASLPEGKHSNGGMHVVQMYARIQGGITARLGSTARNGQLKISSVMLDGPYGGFEGNLNVYDRALLLGGGPGIAFVVPLLLDLVRSYEAGQTRCNTVHLVWVVHISDALSWFENTLQDAINRVPKGLSISISCYVTTDTADDVSGTKDEDGTLQGISRHSGRPDLGFIVRQFCNQEGSAAVAVCGPASFTLDVGNAVSECELAIVRGTAACSEIYMHQESYGW